MTPYIIVIMLFLPGSITPFTYDTEYAHSHASCIQRARKLTGSPTYDTVVSKATGTTKVIGSQKAWCVGPEGTLFNPNMVPSS